MGISCGGEGLWNGTSVVRREEEGRNGRDEEGRGGAGGVGMGGSAGVSSGRWL